MRYAVLMLPEIREVLARYRDGEISRDDAHLELREFELLDVEIADMLDKVESEKS